MFASEVVIYHEAFYFTPFLVSAPNSILDSHFKHHLILIISSVPLSFLRTFHLFRPLFIASFVTSSLPPSLPPSLPSFLPSYLPPFLPSFILPFLACFLLHPIFFEMFPQAPIGFLILQELDLFYSVFLCIVHLSV